VSSERDLASAAGESDGTRAHAEQPNCNSAVPLVVVLAKGCSPWANA